MPDYRRIAPDEIELIESIKKYVDVSWDKLNDWEKKFVEDILEKFDQYHETMYLSIKQVESLLKVSEKII